jgi:hypothetical protein
MLTLFVAYIFSYNFWGAVVTTAGYDEISNEASSKGNPYPVAAAAPWHAARGAAGRSGLK